MHRAKVNSAFEGFVADQPDGFSIGHREKVYDLEVLDPARKV